MYLPHLLGIEVFLREDTRPRKDLLAPSMKGTHLFKVVAPFMSLPHNLDKVLGLGLLSDTIDFHTILIPPTYELNYNGEEKHIQWGESLEQLREIPT